MTHSTTSVTADDVVDALGTSERFPKGTPQFGVFTPFIGHLIDVVGNDRIDMVVGIGSICNVTSSFVSWLSCNQEFLDQIPDEASMVAHLYPSLARQLQDVAADPEGFLNQLGITEATAMEMESLGLRPEALSLYRNGELTFARLLTICPEVFIPRS